MSAGSIGAAESALLEDPTLEYGDTPSAASLCVLLAAWSEWPKRDGLPPRLAFDPIDFPKLLPWIGLIEFDRHPNDYRGYDALYRYVGSSRAELFKTTRMTGQYASTLASAERWFGVYDRLIERRTPLVVRGKPYLVSKAFMRFEMLLLPLCRNDDADGKEIAFNLSCVHFEAANSGPTR
jgi:hypothetical protein